MTEVRIEYLADHPQLVPLLGAWFYREWAPFYQGQTRRDVEAAVAGRANRGAIPLTIVALQDSGEPVGTVCLKAHDMDTRMELGPWLAGLYVCRAKRRQGLGSLLVSAIEEEARALGVERLHLYTPSQAVLSGTGLAAGGAHGLPRESRDADGQGAGCETKAVIHSRCRWSSDWAKIMN